MPASKIGDVGLNPYSEDLVEAPDEVVINIQDHVQAHVQAENRRPSRRHVLQWVFTTMAINGTLIYDFSTNPLSGFYIFCVYCGLFLGLLLLLLAATLPRLPISATVVKKMVRTTLVLLYIELGLKVAILILYKK